MRRLTSRSAKRGRARAGFMLAELLVALMIFGVGALAMVATASDVMELITASKSRTTAAEVAEARFERMRSQPCSLHTSDSTTTRGVGESWQVVNLAGADDVTVRVTFTSNHGTQTRVFRTFLPC